MVSLVLENYGKVFVLGEYAVLYGMQGILASVRAPLKITFEEGVKEGVLVHSFFYPAPFFLEWSEIKQKSSRDLLSSAFSLFQEKRRKQGKWKITIEGELEARYGLGSSAALVAGLIQGLWEYSGVKLSRKELFSLACRAVRRVQPQNSCADLACVLEKRAILYQKGKWQPLPIPFPLSLYYSGKAAPTKKVVPFLRRQIEKKPALLYLLGALVRQGVQAIEKKDAELFAKTLILYHLALAPFAWSTKELEQQYQKLLKKSAGAKLCGAGQGDCFLAVDGPKMKDPLSLPFSVQ